jgi:hypothetical protein
VKAPATTSPITRSFNHPKENRTMSASTQSPEIRDGLEEVSHHQSHAGPVTIDYQIDIGLRWVAVQLSLESEAFGPLIFDAGLLSPERTTLKVHGGTPGPAGTKVYGEVKIDPETLTVTYVFVIDSAGAVFREAGTLVH